MNQVIIDTTYRFVPRSSAPNRGQAQKPAQVFGWNAGLVQGQPTQRWSAQAEALRRAAMLQDAARWQALVSSQTGMPLPKRNPMSLRNPLVSMKSWFKGLVSAVKH